MQLVSYFADTICKKLILIELKNSILELGKFILLGLRLIFLKNLQPNLNHH